MYSTLAMFSVLVPKNDRVYKFVLKYADRILDAFKKSKSMANVRDQAKVYYRNIRKQIPIEGLSDQMVPAEIVTEFSMIQERNEEAYDDKEFTTEALSFRFNGWLQNYDATKGKMIRLWN